MESARKDWAEKMDRRKTRRVRIKLDGKLFVPHAAHESDCIVLDLSSGGAGIRCKKVPPTKTKVVLYVAGFGRFEGETTNPTAEGTRIRFECSPRKRQKIDEQLIAFFQEGVQSESTKLRANERVPHVGIANFVCSDGEVVQCEVLDISLTGVSLKTEGRPPVDAYVRVGRMLGRVMRHHAVGIGVMFIGDPRGSLQNRNSMD